MKKTFINLAIFMAMAMVSVTSVHADKPVDNDGINPNGFPSGAHYNLNIHGKKADFSCPELEYYEEILYPIDYVSWGEYLEGQLVKTCPDGFVCSETDIPAYGNSIFVPEEGTGIEIFMQSGKKGGKGSKAEALPVDELWAVDPCAGFDGDGAVIQLPPGEYDVYARALAKPTDDPYMKVTPNLIGAEDENENDLVYLGLVTDDGFATPFGTFTRSKGRSEAIPITGLFEWSGSVCYLVDPLDGTVANEQKICYDVDGDLVYDTCCTFDPDTFEPLVCSDGSVDTSQTVGDLVDLYCQTYTSEWIFNIADFVNYLWDTENNGLKLLQIRFYPR